MSSAVIIPCYKEEKRIDLNQYKEELNNSSSFVVFVDDGSPDKTFNVLKSLEAEYPVLSWTEIGGTHRKTSDYFKCLIEYFKIWKKYCKKV